MRIDNNKTTEQARPPKGYIKPLKTDGNAERSGLFSVVDISTQEGREAAIIELARFTNLESASASRYLKKMSKASNNVDSVLIRCRKGTVTFVPMRERNVATAIGDWFKGVTRSNIVRSDGKVYVSKRRRPEIVTDKKTPGFEKRLHKKIKSVGAGLNETDRNRLRSFEKIVKELVRSDIPKDRLNNAIWKSSPHGNGDQVLKLAKFHLRYRESNPALYGAIQQIIGEIDNETKDSNRYLAKKDDPKVPYLISFLSVLTQSDNKKMARQIDAAVRQYDQRDFDTLLADKNSLIDINDILDRDSVCFEDVQRFVSVAQQMNEITDLKSLNKRLKENLARVDSGNGNQGRFKSVSKENLENLIHMSNCTNDSRRALVDAVVEKTLASYGPIGEYLGVLIQEKHLVVSKPDPEVEHTGLIDSIVRFSELEERYRESNLNTKGKRELGKVISLLASNERSFDVNRADSYTHVKQFLEMIDTKPRKVRALLRKQGDQLRQAERAAPLGVGSVANQSDFLSNPVHYANMLARNFSTGNGWYARQMVEVCLADYLDRCGDSLSSESRKEVQAVRSLYQDGMVSNSLFKSENRESKVIMTRRLADHIDAARRHKFPTQLYTVSNARHATNLTISNVGGRVLLTLYDSNGGNGKIKDERGKERAKVDLNVDVTDQLRQIGGLGIAEQLIQVLDEDKMSRLREVLIGLGELLPSQFYRRVQKGGDCSIESHLGFLSCQLNDRNYRRVKSHILKSAITTLERATSKQLFEDIVQSVAENSHFDDRVDFEKHEINPRNIVTAPPAERAKLIEEFRANSIAVLKDRLEANEYRIKISSNVGDNHSIVDYASEDEELEYSIFKERSLIEINDRETYSRLTAQQTHATLADMGYERVKIYGDGYCGQRCALVIALEHVRQLRRDNQDQWQMMATSLMNEFHPSEAISRLIFSDDPLLDGSGRFPKSIEKVIRRYPDQYIDQQDIRDYVTKILGMSSNVGDHVPYTGIVSLRPNHANSGPDYLVTFQSIMGNRAQVDLFGPLSDPALQAQLPSSVIRFTEGRSELGNHYDIFRPAIRPVAV